MEHAPANSLQFKEFANYVHRSMANRGFRREDDLQKADLAIFLRYGIGDPESTAYTYSFPVYGSQGGGTATFSGTTTGQQGTSWTQETIHLLPSTGVVGHRTQTIRRTTYHRWVILDAFDLIGFRETEELHHVWNTTIASEGNSGDLRRAFPVLILEAGFPVTMWT